MDPEPERVWGLGLGNEPSTEPASRLRATLVAELRPKPDSNTGTASGPKKETCPGLTIDTGLKPGLRPNPAAAAAAAAAAPSCTRLCLVRLEAWPKALPQSWQR